MRLLVILLFIFSSFVFASDSEFEYKSLELVSAPLEAREAFTSYFRTHGLLGFKNAEEFTEVGLNQIFFSSDLHSFVSVKFGVEGNFPLNKVMEVGGGRLVHYKYDDVIVAFHFLNVSQVKLNGILSHLPQLILKKKTSLLEKLNPISSAHADADCAAVSLAVMGTTAVSVLTSVTMSTIISGLTSCLSGAEEEVKSASGFNFASAVSSEASRLWKNPGKRVGEYWGAAKETVTGLGSLIYNIGYAILHPTEAAQKLGAVLGEAGEMLSSVIGVLAQVPNAAVSMICSLITGIGVRAFVAAISGGAAAILLATKLRRIVQGISTISSLMSKMKSLGISQLERLGLSPESLARLFAKMSAGTFEERRLRVFVDTLDADSPYVKGLAKRGLQCAL